MKLSRAFKNEQLNLYRANLIAQQNADEALINLQNQLIDDIQRLNEVLIVKGFLLMHTIYALLKDCGMHLKIKYMIIVGMILL